MDDLIMGFVEESEELLEDIGGVVLKLESNPKDQDLIQELFRCAHTLKGSAGIVGAKKVADMSHVLEEFLEDLKEGEAEFTSDSADVLLSAFDYIGFLANKFGKKEDIPDNDREYNEILDRLRSLHRSTSDNSSKKLKPALQNAVQSERQDEKTYRLILKFDSEIFGTGQDPLLIVEDIISACNVVDVVIHDEALPALAEIDPELIHVWFEFVIRGGDDQFQAINEVLEFLDRERNEVVIEEMNCSSKQARLLLGKDAVLALAEVIRQQKLYISYNEGKETHAPSLYRTISFIAQALGCEEISVRYWLNYEIPWSECLRSIEHLESLLKDYSGDISGENSQGSVELKGNEGDKSARNLAEKNENAADEPASEPLKDEKRAEKKYVRIDEKRLEKLFELSGELTVAKNGLPYLVRKLEIMWDVPEAARELKEKYQMLEQISRELQDIVMELRLLPVGQIFQRFPRFVRDMSKKLGKRVQVIVEGEETQIDKTVMEKVYEPLLHLIRNSLDHGLETPEERAMRGKPEEGTLWLRAGQDGHSVYIEVEDDGRGLDVKRIRDTAVAKGLISEDEIERLDDQEALRLIFLPGFSTKNEAGELSGRGVGMDVVKETVESLGGSIGVDNRPGEGFLAHISLPLTLATTKILMVRVGMNNFGLPLDDVQEVVRLSSKDFYNIMSTEAIYLRGKVTPVIRLSKVLDVVYEERETYCVVVLKSGIGIVVDDFEREVDVLLKPLPPELNGIEVYTGASILSDGSVLLVLNTKELSAAGDVFARGYH